MKCHTLLFKTITFVIILLNPISITPQRMGSRSAVATYGGIRDQIAQQMAGMSYTAIPDPALKHVVEIHAVTAYWNNTLPQWDAYVTSNAPLYAYSYDVENLVLNIQTPADYTSYGYYDLIFSGSQAIKTLDHMVMDGVTRPMDRSQIWSWAAAALQARGIGTTADYATDGTQNDYKVTASMDAVTAFNAVLEAKGVYGLVLEDLDTVAIQAVLASLATQQAHDAASLTTAISAGIATQSSSAKTSGSNAPFATRPPAARPVNASNLVVTTVGEEILAPGQFTRFIDKLPLTNPINAEIVPHEKTPLSNAINIEIINNESASSATPSPAANPTVQASRRRR